MNTIIIAIAIVLIIYVIGGILAQEPKDMTKKNERYQSMVQDVYLLNKLYDELQVENELLEKANEEMEAECNLLVGKMKHQQENSDKEIHRLNSLCEEYVNMITQGYGDEDLDAKELKMKWHIKYAIPVDFELTSTGIDWEKYCVAFLNTLRVAITGFVCESYVFEENKVYAIVSGLNTNDIKKINRSYKGIQISKYGGPITKEAEFLQKKPLVSKKKDHHMFQLYFSKEATGMNMDFLALEELNYLPFLYVTTKRINEVIAQYRDILEKVCLVDEEFDRVETVWKDYYKKDAIDSFDLSKEARRDYIVKIEHDKIGFKALRTHEAAIKSWLVDYPNIEAGSYSISGNVLTFIMLAVSEVELRSFRKAFDKHLLSMEEIEEIHEQKV